MQQYFDLSKIKSNNRKSIALESLSQPPQGLQHFIYFVMNFVMNMRAQHTTFNKGISQKIIMKDLRHVGFFTYSLSGRQ
jgi:hypothetical protein